MNRRRGFFLVIDGPSGVGKDTVAMLLSQQLRVQGWPVVSTQEPSSSRIGVLARTGTELYRGLALACLVAADRYHHLAHNVRPALAAGQVVICARYVPSSLVLQQLDGVDGVFLWQLNQLADRPDLTVILNGDPEQSQARAAQRGTYSRFHRAGLAAAQAEAAQYRQVAHELTEAGYLVAYHEIAGQSAEAVVAERLPVVLKRLAGRAAQADAASSAARMSES